MKRSFDAHPDFVHLFANANEGDIRAKFDETIRPLEGNPVEFDHFIEAHKIGEQLAESVFNEFTALTPSDGAVPILSGYLEIDSAEAPWLCGDRSSSGGRDRVSYGAPTLAGSEEGQTGLSEWLAKLLGLYEGNAQAEDGCQGTKEYPLGEVSVLIADPLSYPRWISVQVIRIGDLLMVTVPGEATAEMGARIKDAVLGEAQSIDPTITSVALVGLANQFVSYFTTPEEYAAQHYEGGSTIFGPRAGEYLQHALVSFTTTTLSIGETIDVGIADREIGVPDDDELWPDYEDEPEREHLDDDDPNPNVKLASSGQVVATFDWRDTESPSTIELDRPLVKIQVLGEGGFVDYIEDGVPQDDQGVDIEVRQIDEEEWRATWYGTAGQVRSGEYRFVIAGRSYAGELTSNSFRWSQ